MVAVSLWGYFVDLAFIFGVSNNSQTIRPHDDRLLHTAIKNGKSINLFIRLDVFCVN